MTEAARRLLAEEQKRLEEAKGEVTK